MGCPLTLIKGTTFYSDVDVSVGKIERRYPILKSELVAYMRAVLVKLASLIPASTNSIYIYN